MKGYTQGSFRGWLGYIAILVGWVGLFSSGDHDYQAWRNWLEVVCAGLAFVAANYLIRVYQLEQEKKKQT